jgi:ABC-2 type transport system permease protein
MTTAAVPAGALAAEPNRISLAGYVTCLLGIVWREVMRFLHQRERFFSALVRPLIWLFIFAAGFRQVLGVSIIPPYTTYVLYETFVMPGLVGMILLFNAMQSSLSMVYDRETGAMRTLLVSPFPRSFLLLSKLLGGVFVALLQAYTFLFIARLWEAWTWSGQDPVMTNLSATAQQLMVVDPAPSGYLTVLPALILSGLMLGSLALFMSSVIKQLENFAGVMNFVIFPMFFASSALYPLWRIRESSVLLYEICRLNPFTHAVELIRFGLYGQIGAPVEQSSQAAADGWSFAVVNGVDLTHLYVVVGCTLFFLGAAIYAYNPSKGLIGRRGGAGAGA